MRGFLVGACAVVVVSVLAGDAFARDILVPKDHRNLQDALDTAQPGDRVLIRKRALRGYYSVSTNGVEIASDHPRGTRLTGKRNRRSELGVKGLIEVSSNEVTIRGFEFVRGGLHVFGNDVIVENCSFRDQAPGDRRATALHVSGNGATIRDTDIDLTHRGETYVLGIDIEGDGALVSGTTVEADDKAMVLSVMGDDARVEGNAFGEFSGPSSARIAGDRATVTDNSLRGDTLRINTEDGLVSGNFSEGVEFGDAALAVRGDRNRILQNEVRNSADTAILVYGDGNLIEDNSVSDIGTVSAEGVRFGNGFVVRGSANRINANTSNRVVGEGFRIAGNTDAELQAEGVYLPGAETRVRGAGNELVDCTGNRSGRCGIGNWTLGTVVTGCTFQGNGADVVDGGSFDFFQRNIYSTGGPGYNGGGDGVFAPDFGSRSFEPDQLGWE